MKRKAAIRPFKTIADRRAAGEHHEKRFLSILLILILVLLFGCAPQKTIRTARQMNVVIGIECEEVYSLGMTYCVNDTLLGSQVCTVAPTASRPLPKGDKVYFTFTELDFESVPDFEGGTFSFTLEVGLKNGEYIPLDGLWQWNARYEEEYRFTLRRDDRGSFVLEAENEDLITAGTSKK